MKIAFLYNTVYPYVKGGVEKRIYELAKRLSKHHEVYIIGYRYWNNSNPKHYGNIKYYGTAPPAKLYSSNRRSIGEAIYYTATMAKAIDIIAKEKIDIVDVQNTPYLHYPVLHLAKKLKLLPKTKLLLTWHEAWREYWYEYLGKHLGIIGYTVERLLAKLSKNNITVSKRTKLILETLGAKNITIIPNGIDYKLIQNIPPSKEHQSDIIYAGRLTYEKKVETLIQAVYQLKQENKDIKCIIIGHGPKKPLLRKLIQQLHLQDNIKLLDPVNPYTKYVSVLKASKVFVLPSTREGFSITTLEANAAGLPVITFKHPLNAANDLIINGYNGYKIPVNSNILADYIIKSLDMYKLMKKHSVRLASLYEWDNIVKELEEYLQYYNKG